VSDGEEVRCVGKLFHRLAAKTGKARLPDGSKVEGWHDQLVGGSDSSALIVSSKPPLLPIIFPATPLTGTNAIYRIQ